MNIEPNPEPTEATGSAPSALGALTALQATGRDAGGHTTVTLDGRGRLTDLVLDDLVVADGRRAVEQSVREAFDAAADELDRLRQAEAARMLEAGQLQLSALTGQLQQLSDHADARLRDALRLLSDQSGRIGGPA